MTRKLTDHPSNQHTPFGLPLKGTRAKTAEKAKRKSEVLTPRFLSEQWDAMVDDSKWDEWRVLLKQLDPPLSDDAEFSLLKGTQFALAALLASRKVSAAGAEEALTRFLTLSEQFSEAWIAICKHEALRESVNSALLERARQLAVHLVEKAKSPPSWAVQLSQHDSLIDYVDPGPILGMIALGVREALVPLVATLVDARRNRQPAEFKFMIEITELWRRATGSIPSPSRNKYTSKRRTRAKRSASSLFLAFVKAVVPKPEISEEIIRSARENVLERFGGASPQI